VSGFFQSEIVRNAIIELDELQTEIIQKTFSAPIMDTAQKKEHVELMRNFLEKQKNLYFRLSLSDDTEAVEMKGRIQEAAAFLGMDPNQNMTDFFKDMEKTLDRLEEIAER
jgi:hypothetical protein